MPGWATRSSICVMVSRSMRSPRAAAMEMRGDHAGRFPFMRPEEREVAHLADFMEANPLNADRRVLFALIKALDLDHDARLKLALATVGDPDARIIVELAFADMQTTFARSEERRVGKECVSSCQHGG